MKLKSGLVELNLWLVQYLSYTCRQTLEILALKCLLLSIFADSLAVFFSRIITLFQFIWRLYEIRNTSHLVACTFHHNLIPICLLWNNYFLKLSSPNFDSSAADYWRTIVLVVKDQRKKTSDNNNFSRSTYSHKSVGPFFNDLKRVTSRKKLFCFTFTVWISRLDTPSGLRTFCNFLMQNLLEKSEFGEFKENNIYLWCKTMFQEDTLNILQCHFLFSKLFP